MFDFFTDKKISLSEFFIFTFFFTCQKSETPTNLSLCTGPDQKIELKGEIAVVVVKGSVLLDGEKISAGQMLVSQTEDSCCLELEDHAQLLLFGGQPLPEERFLMWNFASSEKTKLEEAKANWIAKRFPKVPGDNTYIPFPG